MYISLVSAILTFFLWLGGFIAIFGVLGFFMGKGLSKLVPKDQDHLPPHMLFWLPMALGLAVGAIDGIHVAAPEAALAAGDAALLRVIIVRHPWTPSPPSSEAAHISWRSSLQDSFNDLSPARLAMILLGKAAIGPALGPAISAKIIFDTYQEETKNNPGRSPTWPSIWWKARPRLESFSMVTVCASLSLGLLYITLIGCLALFLVATANRDLRKREKSK